jgi:hypothetical protein
VPTLSGILLNARKNNIRDDITGALICRHDIYLQLLEGPAKEIQAAAVRIGRDDRHVDVNILVSRKIDHRIFADWAMLHDPAISLIWTEAEITDGILDRATPQDFQNMFETLAEKVKNEPPV